ncbi:hypothetical protein CHS0354_016865 [Potamilus streckersoni]|nr:hypothetical protein CHS0354_016865 [Potamilus streckersoni]
MESNGKSLSELMKCPICYDVFLKPRTLPCLHSFCQACLQSHIVEQQQKETGIHTIKCSVCRAETGPPVRNKPVREWAKYFPVNPVIVALLDSKPDGQEKLCEPCRNEGLTQVAIAICKICQEPYCDDCLRYHTKFKVSRDHVVENLQKQPQSLSLPRSLPIAERRHSFEMNAIAHDRRYFKDEIQPLSPPRPLLPKSGRERSIANTAAVHSRWYEKNYKLFPTKHLDKGVNISSSKDRVFEKVKTFKLKGPNIKPPKYTGIGMLSSGQIIVIDNNNHFCVLFNKDYTLSSMLELEMSPVSLAIVKDSEVAISLKGEKKIVFINVTRHALRLEREILTERCSYRISPATQNYLAVAWFETKGDQDVYSFGVVESKTGNEILHLEKDSSGRSLGYFNDMLVNPRKSYVLQTSVSSKALFCFRLTGEATFSYCHRDLQWPTGVAVDQYDRIYVTDYVVGDIHQLTPDGKVLHVCQVSQRINNFTMCCAPAENILLLTHKYHEEIEVFRFKYVKI